MKLVTFCLISLCLVHCTSPQRKEQQEMREAAIIHNAMVKRAEELEDKLNHWMADSAYVLLQDSIKVWNGELEYWESEVVEVPGNEDHRHKEGGHHHNHQPLEVTASEMKTIQMELQRRLQAIEERINQGVSLK